jgi:hypothetical protein
MSFDVFAVARNKKTIACLQRYLDRVRTRSQDIYHLASEPYVVINKANLVISVRYGQQIHAVVYLSARSGQTNSRIIRQGYQRKNLVRCPCSRIVDDICKPLIVCNYIVWINELKSNYYVIDRLSNGVDFKLKCRESQFCENQLLLPSPATFARREPNRSYQRPNRSYRATPGGKVTKSFSRFGRSNRSISDLHKKSREQRQGAHRNKRYPNPLFGFFHNAPLNFSLILP